jgi:hypothetical protein
VQQQVSWLPGWELQVSWLSWWTLRVSWLPWWILQFSWLCWWTRHVPWLACWTQLVAWLSWWKQEVSWLARHKDAVSIPAAHQTLYECQFADLKLTVMRSGVAMAVWTFEAALSTSIGPSSPKRTCFHECPSQANPRILGPFWAAGAP